MSQSITWVGIDAHKKTLFVAARCGSELRQWQVANQPKAVAGLAKKLVKDAPGEVRCCYEAGPTGFSLQRQLQAAGALVCEVIAPSLIPVKAGERVKTDRRDAQKLASYLEAGLLTVVQPPSPEDEAARDLMRCRSALVGDLTKAKHRLSKFLLRQGMHYTGGKTAWTRMYFNWLSKLRFEHPAAEVVFQQYLLAIHTLKEQLCALEAKIHELSVHDTYKEAVGVLRCFHGVNTVAAMTLLTEIHDFRRFDSPRKLMSYLGLTPSEHSSGESRNQGSITKTGTAHGRRMLVESAWHYRRALRVGPGLRHRREGQPAWAIDIATKAHQRLSRRYHRLTESGKPSQKVAIAVARELAGFIWAMMHRLQQQKLLTEPSQAAA